MNDENKATEIEIEAENENEIETEKNETETENENEAKAEAEAVGFVARILTDLREAGETGKKQWEETIKKTRTYFTKRREDAEASTEAEQTAEEAPVSENETVEAETTEAEKPWKVLRERSAETFAKAQDRGADLLLRLLTRVREGVESVEKSLKEARAPEEAEASQETAAAA